MSTNLLHKTSELRGESSFKFKLLVTYYIVRHVVCDAF